MRARMLVAVAFAAALGARCGAVPSARSEPSAEPRIEASGFVGVDWFGDRSELGNSWAPEQVPGTAPVVGARAGWVALPALPGDLELALEAELAFAPAFTGSRLGAGRMAYFAPVFEWRGQAVLRFTRWGALVPHVVLGGGGDSVATHSPFMADDTDPIGYWGAGFTAPVPGGWQLRLDLHQGVMPSRDGGAHLTAELELGLGIAFGSPARPRPSVAAAAAPPPPAAVAAAPPPPPPADRDPAPDPDGDGITGDADRCPDQPEDQDGFEDDDGCPDPDNDGDGIPDASDGCPDQPETVNGWQDADGCPDELPAEVSDALATTVRFEPGHARVGDSAGAALRALYAVLDQHPEVRLAIVGHPERAGGEDLARRRAEAVKWRLVDLGIAEDQIVTRVGAVVGPPAITFQLVPPPASPPPASPP